MGVILITKEVDAAENRIGRSSAKTAYATGLHCLTQLNQQVQVLRLTSVFRNVS
jgi:hypothetical protein